MNSIKFQLVTLLAITFLVKLLAICYFELSYPESYYLTYAQYPAICQFDHPPMVGFMILASTLNLLFCNDFLIRLGPILLSTACIYIIYLIGKTLRNPRTGLIAAYLSCTSIYAFVFAGIFVLPDNTYMFFGLLSFYFFARVFSAERNNLKNLDLFLAFLFLGLSIYSKYFAIFIALGAFLQIVIMRRDLLEKVNLYLFSILPLIFIALIIYGSYQMSFSGIEFHEERVGLSIRDINWASLFQQIGGQIGFANIVFFLAIFALVKYKTNKFMTQSNFWFVILCSIPLIITVDVVALFSDTRPHWTGLSFIILSLISAAYLDTVLKTLKIPAALSYILCFLALYAIGTVAWGWYYPAEALNKKRTDFRWGSKDLRLYVYGWKEAEVEFRNFLQNNPQYRNYPLVSSSYRTTSNLDHYIARPNNLNVYTFGNIKDMHKYFWIDKRLPVIPKHSNALYITLSYRYIAPEFGNFSSVNLLAKIPIYMSGVKVEYMFIYELIDYNI